MPYIHRPIRFHMNKIVEDIKIYSKSSEGIANGRLNYILFKLCKDTCKNYSDYKNFIGELNECVAEIRRRLLAPYEDLKRQENGDIE